MRSNLILVVLCILGISTSVCAQKSPLASPSPTPPREEQEPVKVFTEEVRLPVIALDQFGNYDPTLEIDDVLILEDGVAQQVRSIRHIPANVLLLIDTGNQLGLKKTYITRDTAARLMGSLVEGSRIAVMQFSEKPEILQRWTSDKAEAKGALKKLRQGKRSSLADALVMAMAQLKDTPAGSRHVVLLTDGADSSTGRTTFVEAAKQLNGVQAVLHVISDSALSLREIDRRSSSKRGGDGVQRDANPASNPVANGDPTLPPGATRTPSFRLGSINTDLAMRRKLKEQAIAIKTGEQALKGMAEESGGQIWRGDTAEDLMKQSELVARDIGAEYVVTYRPQRALALARRGEYRRIEIAPRRSGLSLRSRRGYVVPSDRNE